MRVSKRSRERKPFNKHFNEHPSEVKFIFFLASNSEENRERKHESNSRG